MKTTIKLGMLTAAFLLVFASCSNIVKDPVAADNSAVKSVMDNSDVGQKFWVSSITGTSYGQTGSEENAHYEVKITFSYRPDKDTLKNITFRSLQDAADAFSMPKEKTSYKPSGDIRVVDNAAYFTFDFKPSEVKDLYVFIDANNVKAENGAKLNHDEDDKPGEGGVGGDDSYAYLLHPDSGSLAQTATVTGNVAYDQTLDVTGTDVNKTWGFRFTSATGFEKKGGSEADKKKYVKVKVSAFGPYDVSELDAMKTFIEPLMNTHVKVQEYNWKEGKWVDVKASFKYDSGTAWVADVSITDGCYARVKYVDQRKIPSYTTKLYGYKIKYSLKNNLANEKEVAQSADASIGSLTSDNTFWPTTDLDVARTSGKVVIKFKSTVANTVFSDAAYFENSWHNVKVINKDATKKPLFNGFDVKSVTKDNFKCYKMVDGNNKSLAIKSIDVIKADVSAYPAAFNEITIVLESEQIPDVVCMSPDVKVASFEGSDDRSPIQSYNFPAMSFANNKPLDANTALDIVEKAKGWCVLQ